MAKTASESPGSYLLVVLRWIAVVPGAFLAAIYCQLLILAFGLTLPLSGVPAAIVEQLLGSAITVYYFVYGGCLVAPSRRKATAAALFALWIAFIGLLIYWSITKHLNDIPIGWLVVNTVLGLVAGVIAVLRVSSEGDAAFSVREQDPRWYSPIMRVALFTARIGYVYGFCGQPILFGALAWDELRSSWLNILNPLFDFETVVRMLLTPTFWILLALTWVSYTFGNWIEKKIDAQPVAAATSTTTDKEQLQEPSTPTTLPDYIEQAVWERFQGSPFAKNLYLNAYGYAVLAHSYQMVKTMLYDSSIPTWRGVGLSSSDEKVKKLGAYFGFLLAQSMIKSLRSEEPSMLALERDTALVTDLLFGDQMEAKLAAESDAKRLAFDMQDALQSFHNGAVMAPTIDALLGSGPEASTDPSRDEKIRVAGNSFGFHRENVPKSLRYAADRMK